MPGRDFRKPLLFEGNRRGSHRNSVSFCRREFSFFSICFLFSSVLYFLQEAPLCINTWRDCPHNNRQNRIFILRNNNSGSKAKPAEAHKVKYPALLRASPGFPSKKHRQEVRLSEIDFPTSKRIPLSFTRINQYTVIFHNFFSIPPFMKISQVILSDDQSKLFLRPFFSTAAKWHKCRKA